MENRFLRVEFDEAGDIVRILDKENDREVLPPGVTANQFQALEDRPMNWDAWDIDIFIDDKMWSADPATSIKVVEEGKCVNFYPESLRYNDQDIDLINEYFTIIKQ